MRTKELLQELIGLVETFDASVPESEALTLNDFIAYLNRLPVQRKDDKMIINISKNVSLLHRYSKFYLKKVLKNSSLQTIDEYSYLICLFYNESLTKTELNNMNAMEKTSGNEVIRRLLKSHLIKQQKDLADKRSMRVSITEQGKAEINKIFPELCKAAILLSGPLSDGEKASLNCSLSTLCDYHYNIFIGQKNAGIDDILSEMPKIKSTDS
ncbi:MAG: MarR family winged helix-turn-helix transcriptional regulator [Bacteroidota bacterium]|nr:MarR family winged helix-turn-helix transcriptional regulator [Bacteroidota bacterium]MDP4227127.1 MarR family winged helix-turn-helix transcriptional regulator [Bacteroidota bacterium]MDP4275357.1 MarR family winged helix-turn-helix transcriptional regulator [Bacteroidota bacterium]